MVALSHLFAMPVTKTSLRTLFSSFIRFPRLMFCVKIMTGRNIPTIAPTTTAKMAPPVSLFSGVGRGVEVEEWELLGIVDEGSACNEFGALVPVNDGKSSTPMAVALSCAPVLSEAVPSANVFGCSTNIPIVVPSNIPVGGARVSISRRFRRYLGTCIANRVHEEPTCWWYDNL